MTIKEIIKQDLKANPQKRNNMQYCISCMAYGVDLNKIDRELEKELEDGNNMVETNS